MPSTKTCDQIFSFVVKDPMKSWVEFSFQNKKTNKTKQNLNQKQKPKQNLNKTKKNEKPRQKTKIKQKLKN